MKYVLLFVDASNELGTPRQRAGRLWVVGQNPKGVILKSQVRRLDRRSHAAMALQEFKIIFKDGSTQTVTAGGSPVPQGGWLVFADGSGEVLRVHGDEVESISRPDVEPRQKPHKSVGV